MTIDRKEKALTEEYLVELLTDDSICRNEYLRAFLEILNDIEHGLSIFIDGKWGSGKTIFVKQAMLSLQVLCGTYKDVIEEKTQHCIGTALEEFEPKFTYLPLYYNAWENDIYDNPMVTLLGSLISTPDTKSFGELSPDTEEKVSKIVDGLLNMVKLEGVSIIREGFTSKDLLKSMKEVQSLQDKIKELIDYLLDGRADKLVLFIDELDRCSPAFALRLLEQIKFMFSLDNVIVVFSTNMSQLAHTVQGFYGPDFNGHEYLTRYFDLKLELNAVEPSDFLKIHGLSETNDFYNRIALEVANSFSFQMRDCLRYLEEIKRIGWINKGLSSFSGRAANLIFVGLAPVIMAVKIRDHDLYEKITSGSAATELFDLASKSTSFTRWLEKCSYQADQEIRHGEAKFKTPVNYYQAVYKEAFDNIKDRVSDQAKTDLHFWGNKHDLRTTLLGF